jgi:predicted secreted Zn-dependent protease
MLQKLLLILLVALPVFRDDDNLIDWSTSRKLTWNDFKGKADLTSPNAALTNSSINVEFGFNNKSLKHSIKCRFNKSLSWVKVKNDYILKHEQGHFDLAEAHARELHKALLDYQFNSATVSKDLNKIYDKVMKEHVSAQEQYDLQTDHSLDSAKQRLWDAKISSMLKEYNDYSNYK